MLYLAAVVLVFPIFTHQQEIGDLCKIKESGADGFCERLQKCGSARKDIKKGNSPQICSFHKLEIDPIVCCIDTPLPGLERINLLLLSSISENECQKYKQLYPTVPSHLSDYTKTTNTAKTLTADNGGVQIPVGSPPTKAEFKHMAALGYGASVKNRVWDCSGSLISQRYVLTAAQCLHSPNNGLVKWVRLGDINLAKSKTGEDPQEFLIEDLYRHPNHTARMMYNDLALIKLDRDVRFTHSVFPACLHEDGYPVGEEFTATGWEKGGEDDLLEVPAEIFSGEECTKSFPPGGKLPSGIDFELQFCGGNRDVKPNEACQADFGGPLQYKDGSLYRIFGVSSFGSICSAINTPAVYTRVASYTSWIESIVWPQPH